MDKATRYQLKSRAHALKPVVLTGQAGITPSLLAEIDGALEHHELIKVRIHAGDKAERRAMLEMICKALATEPVQLVGHVATLFRVGPRRLP
jgi:RNA-binding protein